MVEKEWLHFGHKFYDRLGNPDEPKERSPIFLQFLDCVYQVQDQFPEAFEFNSLFLAALVQHVFSGWFGTFLGNNQKEREDLRLAERTLSVWGFCAAHRSKFTNRFFTPTDCVLMPICSLKRLQLWMDVYLKYDEAFLIRSRGTPTQLDLTLQNSDNVDELVSQRQSFYRKPEEKKDMLRQLTSKIGKQREARDSVWMDDAAASSCLICGAPFTFFRRRHHCRICGRLVCETCSEQKKKTAEHKFQLACPCVRPVF